MGFCAVGIDRYKIIQLGVSLVSLFTVDILQYKGKGGADVKKLPAVFRWLLYLALILCILIFSRKGGVEFVYFQF